MKPELFSKNEMEFYDLTYDLISTLQYLHSSDYCEKNKMSDEQYCFVMRSLLISLTKKIKSLEMVKFTSPEYKAEAYKMIRMLTGLKKTVNSTIKKYGNGQFFYYNEDGSLYTPEEDFQD